MSIAPSRSLLVFCLLSVLAAGALPAQTGSPGEPLASGRLEIRGSRLTLYSDPAHQVSDAEQTINVGERATVRTCFGGPTVPCGSLAAGDPRVAGLTVLAELAGPELPEPLALATVPGGSFVLPSFQQEGDYTLENIRLVSGEGAASQVVAPADPALAVLHVRKIVLSSATVRTLSLAELRARGIELTEENFQAFDFAVGFAIEGQTVEIKFPVLFQGNGLATALAKPRIELDGLPASVVRLVEAWKPPMVQPIRLEPAPERSHSGLDIGEEADEELPVSLYGAIVIPGTVTFLNQFFEAQLIVANGAAAGSAANLGRLRALARLPGNQALRLAETEPPVVPGQWVPVVGSSGSQRLGPGEQGSASWVVEGLRAGTHSLVFEVEGELERPGREPLPVRTLAQAAVEVVDARFQLTFSHPDVVRDLEEYTLFVTVTNQSLADQNLVKVQIREESMTGAGPADPNDPLVRQIEVLHPGESATVEFRLISQITGKVVASAFQSDSANYDGTIRLRTGVGELGIPLSPATLLMPRFTSELEQRRAELVRHDVALLGLAYSLAVAPASLLPPGLSGLSKSEVERRAIDLAEAGERLYLGDDLLRSLEALLLDQLGNRHPLANFDELRRKTTKGLRAAEQMAAALRAEQETSADLDAENLFRHFAETMSYARPFTAALLVPDGPGEPQLRLEAIDRLGGAGLLAGTADEEESASRTLPWGELYSLRAQRGSDEPRASLAVIGHLELGDTTTFLVRNPSSTATVSGTLVLLAPDGSAGRFRRIEYGTLTLGPGQVLAIDAGSAVASAGQGGFRPYDPATGQAVSEDPDQFAVNLPDFAIIGARQDFMIDFSVDIQGNRHQPNRYGNAITYLFNRPPAADLAEVPEAFKIASTFEGVASDDTPFPATTVTRVGEAAFIQPNSERVVIVRYESGISPLITGGLPLVEHEHLFSQTANRIRDRFDHGLADWVAAPRVESAPLHVGGLVSGLVKRGTGEVVAGAKVELIRQRWFEKLNGDWIVFNDLAATSTTGEDGRFFFDYVETPHLDPRIKPDFTLRATVPAGADPLTQPAEVAEVAYQVRQLNKVMKVNIALLGRGGITGRLTYLDGGAAVAGGVVEAASTLFQEQQKVSVDGEGNFRFLALPVGPIALAGRDPQGRRVYASVAIPAAGAVTAVDLKIQRPNTPPPGRGTVTGRILYLRDGVPEEALGARIAVYSDGNFISAKTVGSGGSFTFADVPAGRVSLQAADFLVSRTVVYTDLMLAAGEVAEVELRIPASTAKTISGRILLRDVTSNAPPVGLAGATVLLLPIGLLTHTDAEGRYLIEDVPIQGALEDAYSLQVVTPDGTREQRVGLPRITAAPPDEIVAANVVFEVGSRSGRVSGVVFDPVGNPVPYAEVVLYPYTEGQAGPDGSFVFEEVPLGSYVLVAHVDNGLTAGRVGYIGKSDGFVLEPLATDRVVEVRMVGAGFVKIKTRTATSSGVMTPIHYKPTLYSQAAKDIVLSGPYVHTSTNPNGDLEIEVPAGPFELVADNPFYARKEIQGTVAKGEELSYEIVFESLGKVRGTVVGTDGATPVPFAEVALATRSFLPQTLQADAQGQFLYELVPAGQVTVDARAVEGNVERVGRTLSILRSGEDLAVKVVLLKQATVRGWVKQDTGAGPPAAVPLAQYYVREGNYPHRRLPEEGSFYFTDAAGYYEVPHLFEGPVEIVARDANDPSRIGSAKATVAVDFSLVTAPDIVFRGADAVGRITFLVRDPQSGGPVPDALVRLSTGEGGVTGADGRVVFEALKAGTPQRPETYSARAFYAPTGQAGVTLNDVALTGAGQDKVAEIYLNTRGEIGGYLYEDDSRTTPIAGATVKISGSSAAGRVESLATTSGEAGHLGRFDFSGIPEGIYTVVAAPLETPRRATTTAALTATSPIVDLFLYLELIGDRYFRIDEHLRAGDRPVDLTSGVYAVKVVQGDPRFPDYSFTSLLPEPGTQLFHFEDLFLERSADIEARELGGELRRMGAGVADFAYRENLPGSGTEGDPFLLRLPPKGVVKARVVDSDNHPLSGIDVRLGAPGLSAAGATDGQGEVVFGAVDAGYVAVSARSLDGVSSGNAGGFLVYDDDQLELTIRFQPAVRATGKVYLAPPGDLEVQDPATLAPLQGARVELEDKNHQHYVAYTDAAGVYLFQGLPAGVYAIAAASANGAQIAHAAGTLLAPNGTLNQLPPLVLDASAPRIVQISPGPGAAAVSTNTRIDILFSEPLDVAFLPSGPNSSYFFVRKTSGNVPVAGEWGRRIENGRQRVFFVPAALEDFTLYSVVVSGHVADRAGRELGGDAGSTFRTSDANGPTVERTEPLLTRPVNPAASVRVDFNERVVGDAEALDGDGIADAAVLEARKLDGSWVVLPAVYYLTRLDFSLQLDLPQGLTIPGDSLRRRLTVARLRDESGKPMAEWQREFRLYDSNSPTLAVARPAGAPDGNLLRSTAYTLVPELGNLDDLSAQNPGGDLDRVEYFFADPAVANSPAGYVARSHPFSYTFPATYLGNGSDPWPFPVWVRAVDTSNNASPVVEVAMQVLANVPPEIGGLAAETIAGSAVFYSLDTLRVTVTGIADADSSQLSLLVDLRRTDTGQLVEQKQTTLTRPAGGWPALAPPSLFFGLQSFQLPEGTPIVFHAAVVDSSNVRGEADSPPYEIADDQEPPRITELGTFTYDGEVREEFVQGETVRFKWKVADPETGVDYGGRHLEFDRADFFPQSPAVGIESWSGMYYGDLLLPAGLVTEPTVVVATVVYQDRGGNVGRQSIPFTIKPAADSFAPVVQWRSPFAEALWPADYTSVLPGAGVPLLLRVRATDLTQDEAGETVPGEIYAVEMRGPELAEDGSVRLSETWIEASKVDGTLAPGAADYQLLWQVPNDLPAGTVLTFVARATDLGSSRTTATVQMVAVAARQVYQGAHTAIPPSDPMLDFTAGNPDGPVFFLDGTLASIYPQTDGSLRTLPALFLYSGGFLSNGNLQRHDSRLVPVEINSLDSAILYYPLELGIETFLGVGGGSAIDGDGAGLLGGTLNRPIFLEGMAGPQTEEAGYHGGMTLLAATTPEKLGRVYGDPRWPLLPGLGGRTANVSSDFRQGGGPGGGAIRIEAGEATVQLEGSLTARGLDGPRFGYSSFAGAGGSIALRAGKLAGGGVIDASGGGVSAVDAGGGRVAVVYGQLGADFDPARQILAPGGPADFYRPGAGGAGTIYLEPSGSAGAGVLRVAGGEAASAGVTPLPGLGSGELLAADAGTGRLTLDAARMPGELSGSKIVLEQAGVQIAAAEILGAATVETPQGARVALTVAADPATLATIAGALGAGPVAYHGVQRFARVELAGDVRLLVRDDLALGPAEAPSPQLNDPALIVHDTRARWQLRGQGFGSTASALPPEGEVHYFETIGYTAELRHPLGIESVTREATRQQPSVTLLAEATATVAGQIYLHEEFQPGPVSASFSARALDGTVLERSFTWSLLANEPPTVELVPEVPETRVGQAFDVTVSAVDREGLARLNLAIESSERSETLTFTVPGLAKNAEHHFTVTVPSQASGAIELVATATDGNGAATSSPLATIPIARGAAPSGSWRISTPGPYEAGQFFGIEIVASDPDLDLEALRITAVSGPVLIEPGYELGLWSGQREEFFQLALAAAGETVRLEGELVDQQGNVFELPPLELLTTTDTTPPYLEMTPPLVAEAGQEVAVPIFAGDPALERIEVAFDGQSDSFAASERSTSWTFLSAPLADRAAPELVPIVVRAYDRNGNVSEETREIQVLPDQPPQITLDFYADNGENLAVPGANVQFYVHATDVIGIAGGQLVVSGLTVAQQELEVIGSEAFGSFTWQVPADATPGSLLVVTATATDTNGQTATLVHETYVTRLNLVPPELRLYLDPEPAGGQYHGGDTLSVFAIGRAGEEPGVMTVELSGQSLSGDGVAAGDWVLPQVAVPTLAKVKARFVTEFGQVAALEREITLLPNPAAEVRVACPSDGALLPPGITFPVALEAKAAAGIDRIELYRAGQLVGTLDPAGAPTSYAGSLPLTLPASPGLVQFRAVVVPLAGAQVATTSQLELLPATTIAAGEEVDGTALAGQAVALGPGVHTFDAPLELGELILLPGAQVTHSARGADSQDPAGRVDLRVAGRLYLACGASIDVSGRGPAAAAETRGGANVGGGGLTAETEAGLNPVYRPAQPGGGSGQSRGGGVAAITANALILDGDLHADGAGDTATGGGAGGSLWLRSSGPLTGRGAISANGATASSAAAGSGGGGAVAIEAATLPFDLETRVSARGGQGAHPGGAGAVLLKTAADLTGRLIFDGGGAAPGGWSAVRLLTDNERAVGEFSGNLLTVWEMPMEPEQMIGMVVDLPEPDSDPPHHYFRIDAAHYRVFDCPEGDFFCHCAEEDPSQCPEESSGPANYLVDLEISSVDGAPWPELGFRPFRAAAPFERVSFRGQTKVRVGPSHFDTPLLDVGGTEWGLREGYDSFAGPASLFLRRGATLRGESGNDESYAAIQLERDLVLAAGARIDKSGAASATVRGGATPAGAGASHIGFGGGLVNPPPYFIYDDYRRPFSPGVSVGDSNGGGALFLHGDAGFLAPGSAILANAQAGSGSGGAVYLSFGLLAGEGRTEAKGGTSASSNGGGGGGIRIDFDLAAGSWKERASACGGGAAAGKEAGGAGTVLLFGKDAVGGDLLLDNCGHAGALTPKIDPAAVDSLVVRGGARIGRVLGNLQLPGRLELQGPVTYAAAGVSAAELVLGEGAVLAADPLFEQAFETRSLTLEVSGDLVLASGARIDLSGQGSAESPAEAPNGFRNHIGYYDYLSANARGMTYGSVTRPHEPGSGPSSSGGRGGGVIDITAGNVRLAAGTGLYANGTDAGSGGSIRVRTGELSGDGAIEARGARGAGGGAIALDYAASSGEVLGNTRAWGGAAVSGGGSGGAGSVYLNDRATANFGVLRLDNDGRPGVTELPSLGRGIAAHGTAGDQLATGLAGIPSYFVGHWVRMRDAADIVEKGTWRIAAISGGTVRLEPNGNETIDLEPGDRWRGLYRFDRIELDLLVSFDVLEDPVEGPQVDYLGGGFADGLGGEGEALVAATSELLAPNAAESAADLSVVRCEASELEGLYRIVVPATLFPASRRLDWIRVGNLQRTVNAEWNPERGASFLWAGEPGEVLRLQAFERRQPAAGLSADLPPLPAAPVSLGFGVRLEARERILDLLMGERLGYLLLAREEQLELLEIDREGRAIRSRGTVPLLYADHRLALQDGVLGIAARGGEEDLPDAFFALGDAGFTATPLALGAGLFRRPAGEGGHFHPADAASAGNLR